MARKFGAVNRWRDPFASFKAEIVRKLKEIGHIEVTKSGKATFVIPADKMTEFFNTLANPTFCETLK